MSAFERVNFGLREQAKSTDLIRIGERESRGLQEFLGQLFSNGIGSPSDGVVAGLNVVQGAGASVDVQKGYGFQVDATGLTTDESSYRVISLDAVTNLVVGAAPGAGNERTDIVQAMHQFSSFDSQTVQALDGSGNLTTIVVDKILAPNALVQVKPGTVAPTGTSVAPSPDAGFIVLANVLVPDTGPPYTITDRRPFMRLSPQLPGALVAMAQWRTDGTGVGTTLLVRRGFNVNKATSVRLGVGKYKTIFTLPAPNEKYAVLATLRTNNGGVENITISVLGDLVATVGERATTAQFLIQTRLASTAAFVDTDAGGAGVSGFDLLVYALPNEV